jgi:bifunctional pyridoxal-dependent enzyme with beta-cystathionase and maltose regulon repressor activities
VYLRGNLDLVRRRLAEIPGITLIEPEGTFLLWIDFRGLGLEPDDLTTFLRRGRLGNHARHRFRSTGRRLRQPEHRLPAQAPGKGT